MITEEGILPTDLSVFTVTVNDVDITAAVTTAIIFQDLLSPTWTCEIQVADTNNIIMNAPIKPGCTISIEVESNLGYELSGSKTFEFIVFGINDKRFITSLFQTYTISGVAEELIKNQVTRVRKSYRSQSPTDIASSVIDESLGASLDTDQCDNTITTVLSNISPFTAVSKMCKVAVCENAADMILFQTDMGQFAMKSIEKMYSENESGVTFMLRPAGLKDDQGNATEDLSLCVDDYYVEHYNVMANLGAGMYANKTVSFDFMSKSWSTNDFTFGDDVQQDASMKSWDNDMLETAEANITFIPKHTNLHDDETAFDCMDQWAGSRKSSLMKLEQDKLIIQVPGAVRAWELLGQTFEIDMPSQQSMEEGEDLDKYYKGTYLCISVAHFYGKHGAWVNLAGVKKRLAAKME